MNKNGKKPFGKRLIACALAFSMAVIGASSCGAEEEKQKIYVLGQSKGIEFWDLVEQGAKDAGEELGYEIVYENAENTSDITGQENFILRAIEENADAIVFAPNKKESLKDQLAQADSKGIKLIAIDAETSYAGVSYIGTDNTSAGQIAGRNVNDNILSSVGKIGIVKHSESSETAAQRISGFKSVLGLTVDTSSAKTVETAEETADNGEGNKLELPRVYETVCPGVGDVRDEARELAAKMIDEQWKDFQANHTQVGYVPFKLIYATNEKSTLGVCDAVAEFEKNNPDAAGQDFKVNVVGFNSNQEEIKYLHDNILTGTIVQSPYNMGYLGVKYAGRLLGESDLAGDEITERIPEVVDTGATYIDLDAYSNDKITQLLLNPTEYGSVEVTEGGDDNNG